MLSKSEQSQILFFKALDDFKSEMASEDVEKVRQHVTEIQDLFLAIDGILGDGVQLSDLTRLGEIVGPVMRLVSSFDDYRGLDKKRLVMEIVWLLYRVADTWPDGNRNNINIPFVMGVLERKLERGMVCFAAAMAVDSLYKRMKIGGEV